MSTGMKILTLLSLPIMLCSVLSAFWGYKLWHIFRFFPGLVIGFLLGSIAWFLTVPRTRLIAALWGMTGGDNSLLLKEARGAIIFGLFLGILLGIACVVRAKLSIFLEFFGYGFLVTSIFLAREALSSWEAVIDLVMDGYSGIILRIIIPATAVGCIAGLLGMRLSRIWIIISTAFWGGTLFKVTLGVVWPVLMLIGSLMIPVGIVFQLKTTGGHKQKETGGQPFYPQPQPQAEPTIEMPKEPQEKIPQPEPDIPEAMFCGKCGAKIEGKGGFCPKCGNKVR